MKKLMILSINKIKTLLEKKQSNAILLFVTGFFFAQFMLLNILSTINPLGGWVTMIGTFTTTSILLTVLFVLVLCLIALWLSVVKQENVNETKVTKTTVVKMRNNYSPIDHPRGSTQAVVSGYALG